MYRGVSTLAAMSLCALLLLGLAACDKRDPLQQEILTLQDQIRPPEATIAVRTNLLRNGNNVTANWEYETDWDWEKYAAWLSDNLPGSYKPIAVEPARLQFRRSSPGDMFELEVENNMSNGIRRIRVQFRAFPD